MARKLSSTLLISLLGVVILLMATSWGQDTALVDAAKPYPPVNTPLPDPHSGTAAHPQPGPGSGAGTDPPARPRPRRH